MAARSAVKRWRYSRAGRPLAQDVCSKPIIERAYGFNVHTRCSSISTGHFWLTLTSILTGCYCHRESLSRPLYGHSKCSAWPELGYPPRLSNCLEDDLLIGESDNRQARFSIGPTREHNLKCKTKHPKLPSPPLEVIPLIFSGPSTNRVDLVFFSDGCEFVFNISLSCVFFVDLGGSSCRWAWQIHPRCKTFSRGCIKQSDISYCTTIVKLLGSLFS